MAKEDRRTTHEGGTPRDGVAELPHRRASVTLAVCGEPVVGRALALLLRGPRYDTRFVSVSSRGEVASLEGVHLLLVAPTPGLSAVRRVALRVALGEATAAAGIPMLELVTFYERAEPRHAQVSWPCSAEQLERSIEELLLARPCEEPRWEGSWSCSSRETRSA